MADTQQGVRHQSARDAAGTVNTYDGDLRALFNAVATVPAGSTFNEAFMLWLQSVTGSSADNINDLAALYASQQEDTYNWSSVGSLGLPTLFSWDPVNGTTLPSGTFSRTSSAQEYDGTEFAGVASGIIREGSAAVPSGAKGYLSEPVAVNEILFSNDLSNAAWTKRGSSTAVDQGVTDIGGQTTRMSVGTIFSDDVFQNRNGIFTASGPIAPSFWMKRISTTGTLTVNNGSTGPTGGDWDIDLSAIGADWVGIYPGSPDITEITAWAASGAGNAGIQLISASGFIDFDISFSKLEDTAFSSTPRVTTSSSVTRQADVLDTDVVIPSEFGALLDVTLPSVVGTGNTITILGPDATAEDVIRVDASGNVIMDDGGAPVTIGTASLGTRIKVSYGRDATGRSGSLDGAAVVTGGAPGAGHEGDTFQLGAANSMNQSRCIHHNSVIYSVRPSDSQLESLSS